jgi:hypothetical protein
VNVATNSGSENPLGNLTERESEILRKAGERVFALSKRLADQERESSRLTSEAQTARELLAESREVRRVLSNQVQSLQTALDREYEERSELRRLLASLHIQMQELLPLVTGLARAGDLALPPRSDSVVPSPAKTYGATSPSLARRLFAAAGEIASSSGKTRKRDG